MKQSTVSEHLQDSLIYLSITDSKFLRIIVGQVPEDYFNQNHIRLLYRIISDYYNEFQKAPDNHLHDEVVKRASEFKDSLDTLCSYIEYLKTTFQTIPDKEYVLSRLSNFIKEKTYIQATYQFAELVEKGKFDEATTLMQKTLRSGIQQQEMGVDIFEVTDLSRRDQPERLFSMEIPWMDKFVSLRRSDFVVIAGPYYSGKSWFGHHLAVRALKEGLCVVHVSHENSLDDTIIRYDMMMGGLVSHSSVPVELLVRTMENDRYMEVKKKYDTIYNKKLVLHNRQVYRNRKGKLVVQKFPMGMCSPTKLDSYLEMVESTIGRKIDVVVTDYADIMCPLDSTKQTRDSINETYIYLKRIADDRKLLMITMSQINDEGTQTLIKKGKIDGRHLAEDKRKFANIDIGLFVGTNEDYEKFGEVIIGVFKNRNGTAGYRCAIGQDLRIGQFCIYSSSLEKG